MYVTEQNGEEIGIEEELQVRQVHEVYRGGHETHVDLLNADGAPSPPDAVTPSIAEWIQNEFDVDVREHGVAVIDPEEVELL